MQEILEYQEGPHEEVGNCQGTAGENQDQDDQKEDKGQARRPGPSSQRLGGV